MKANNLEMKNRMLEKIREAAEALSDSGFVNGDRQLELDRLLSQLKAAECFVCRMVTHATADCPRTKRSESAHLALARSTSPSHGI